MGDICPCPHKDHIQIFGHRDKGCRILKTRSWPTRLWQHRDHAFEHLSRDAEKIRAIAIYGPSTVEGDLAQLHLGINIGKLIAIRIAGFRPIALHAKSQQS